MPLRPGEEAKLAPDEEQKLLAQLRVDRELKASAQLQLAVQNLSATMVELDLSEVPAEAKRLCKSEKALSHAPADAQVAIVLNAILRSCNPPSKDTKGKGGGGGKKGTNAVRAAAAKVEEGEPPAGPAMRKALKANVHLLKQVVKGEAGQLALLHAFQSWALSPQGVNALPHAGKGVEVLYDTDQVEEGTLKAYWASLSAQRVREDAELAAAEVAASETAALSDAADAAVKAADKEKQDAEWYLKQAEQLAQARRCGGNPNKDEEAAEKAAQVNLRKCVDFHKQTSRVLAARSKDLAEARAEEEPAKRRATDLRRRREVGVELYATHVSPFFEWLEADDESDAEGAD